MPKSYETTLPKGYIEVYCLDATNKKIAFVLNFVASVIMLAIMLPATKIINPAENSKSSGFVQAFISVAIVILYLILHELTHGVAYKLLTKQKLTFGISPLYAYCGVPDIYIYRKPALISLLAPFVLFLFVFLPAIAVFSEPWSKLFAVYLLSAHIGGCCGDLYNAFLYAVKFRESTILTRDFGAKQCFYKKQSA